MFITSQNLKLIMKFNKLSPIILRATRIFVRILEIVDFRRQTKNDTISRDRKTLQAVHLKNILKKVSNLLISR